MTILCKCMRIECDNPHYVPNEEERIADNQAPDTPYAVLPRLVEIQPAPVPNNRPAIWNLVVGDMIARDVLGRKRYGTPLQPHNGRDALQDAYEEALDLAVYLRQAIYERDNPL